MATGNVIDLFGWLEAEVARRQGRTVEPMEQGDRLGAIEALYVADVYAAADTARRRRLGELDVPEVPAYYYELLERARRRRLGLDPFETYDSLQ